MTTTLWGWGLAVTACLPPAQCTQSPPLPVLLSPTQYCHLTPYLPQSISHNIPLLPPPFHPPITMFFSQPVLGSPL